MDSKTFMIPTMMDKDAKLIETELTQLGGVRSVHTHLPTHSITVTWASTGDLGDDPETAGGTGVHAGLSTGSVLRRGTGTLRGSDCCNSFVALELFVTFVRSIRIHKIG